MGSINLVRTAEVHDEDGTVTRVVCQAHAGWTKGWCARLTLGATTEQGPQLERTFLRPVSTDLTRAGNGSKTYEVATGFYEADSVWRSGEARRHFFVVAEAGQSRFLKRDEAVALLAAAAGRDVGAEHEGAKREADQRLAARRAQLPELPDLRGSEKAVTWAGQIRDRALVRLQGSQRPERFQVVVEAARQRTDAKWWLDRRDKITDSLLAIADDMI